MAVGVALAIVDNSATAEAPCESELLFSAKTPPIAPFGKNVDTNQDIVASKTIATNARG